MAYGTVVEKPMTEEAWNDYMELMGGPSGQARQDMWTRFWRWVDSSVIRGHWSGCNVSGWHWVEYSQPKFAPRNARVA